MFEIDLSWSRVEILLSHLMRSQEGDVAQYQAKTDINLQHQYVMDSFSRTEFGDKYIK